jgi:hypothetical protein
LTAVPDRLTDRFSGLAEDVRGSTRSVSAAAIRARGNRSRQLRVSLAAAALGLATVSTGLLSMSLANGVTGVGASPEPTDLPTVIPKALHMPHEGEPGWVRNDDPETPGAFNPCGGADVTLANRIDAVTMTGPGLPMEEQHSPVRATVQLLLFRDVTAANTAWLRLASDMTGCDWSGGITSGTVYGLQTLIGRSPADLTTVPETIKDALVSQRTNALILRYAETGGSLMSSMDNDGFSALSSQLCATMGLCEAAVCYWPQPSPAAPSPSACAASGSPAVFGSPGPHGSPSGYGAGPSGSAYPTGAASPGNGYPSGSPGSGPSGSPYPSTAPSGSPAGSTSPSP